MLHIDQLLEATVRKNASDLHLKVGSHPVFRIDGQLAPDTQTGKITEDIMERFLEQLATENQRQTFSKELELDFAYYAHDIGRFRVNACIQTGTTSLAIRPVKTIIPTIEELGLPDVCKSLVMKPSGLIIVTGPTGCGKSSTLAAMIGYLNETERRKVVTIEDPIEFIHEDKRCFFYQRELGRDTKSFAQALRHALRQNPDLILVGEMRDLETMAMALTAAETGHLILTTLHTPSAPQSIDRFTDVFPPHQQPQVRFQLSTVLQGVIHQALIPKADGTGRVPVVEIMLATTAVRSLIREGKVYQLYNVIQTGSEHGMQTFDQALVNLYRKELISKKELLAHIRDEEELNNILSGSLLTQ